MFALYYPLIVSSVVDGPNSAKHQPSFSSTTGFVIKSRVSFEETRGL
jgi:hypothetical protein